MQSEFRKGIESLNENNFKIRNKGEKNMKIICTHIDWDIPISKSLNNTSDFYEEACKAYENAGLPYQDVEAPESVIQSYLDSVNGDDDDMYDAISDWLEKKYHHRATNIEWELC